MPRPTGLDSRARRRTFLGLLADGASWRDASKQARISGDTVLTMLDEPEFRTVARALLEGRADTVAVTVAPAERAAA